MENLKCLSTIITNNLAVHIDISDDSSWNLNSGYTVVSLSKWKHAISDDTVLPDFGLTAYDNGRVDDINSSYQLSATDTKLKLYRVGANTGSTGNTSYTSHSISAVVSGTTPFVGKHFELNGGYLQGFFKLKDYKHELLPARFSKGFTIETIIRIDSNSFNDGYYFYMGTRAEDKYLPVFAAESGRTTSEGNLLDSYSPVETLLNTNTGTTYTEIIQTLNDGKDIFDNVMGFQIMSDGVLGITKINKDGFIESISSNRTVSTGWTIITTVFKPYRVVTDKDLLECLPNRLGDLTVYVNGRQFWKIEDFEEFYCKPMDNTKEKQIGVPFNISFGGGSFGLQNSWHFSGSTGNTLVQDPSKADLKIEKYFSEPFKGAIQKLRIYDSALNSQEVLHNASIESDNLGYALRVSKGGRIIYG